MEYIKGVNQNRTSLVLAIIDIQNNKHIGNISIQSIDLINKNAEFAILIGEKEYWGKKIATEAGILIINHAFDNLNLNRIYCGTSSENIGMRKLALKLGFIEEGHRREHLFKNGKYYDVIEFGLLKREWEKRNSKKSE